MSFLNHLFGRHRESEKAVSALMHWRGQSGKEYEYQIFSLGTSFQALPGNYVYARQDEDGSWVPVFIAQTRDLHQRLEGHVREEDAVQHGATHIHAHYCSVGQASRCNEERDLILCWQPVCNELIET